MDDHLERLVHSLRRERCPDSVHERVARRIASEAPGQRPWLPLARRAMAGALALGLLLGSVLLFRHGKSGREGADISAAARSESDRARVVQEAGGALALVGQVLIHAANHAGDALREEAATPLLKEFQSAKTKLTENL